MGYRLVTTEQLGLIWSQTMLGQSKRSIARRLGLDRGTVNAYAERIKALGIEADAPYHDVLGRLSTLTSANAKERPALAALEPLAEEIKGLLNGDRASRKQPMKLKTAWLVVRERHGLEGKTSYESFKRFVRVHALRGGAPEPTIRIEVEPGQEIQIDYAKMGSWAVGGKSRAVYAFVGVLSYSRLPFVLFGTSQDQVSFASAIAAMLAFYGGATSFLNLDNLKAGIIKASLYDPSLNRTFAELCEHYGVIADPARPASPKDKGKVERFVQVARELWKRLTALHPAATLDELNALAAAWAREEYGLKPHGTTGVAPMVAFEETERACLRPLPAEPFVPATWTMAKVHPDQFIQVGKRFYGLPATMIGKRVAVRITASLVEIYFDYKLVRSYPVTGKARQYVKDDFPAHGEPFAPGSYAAHLIFRAGKLGGQASIYLTRILEKGGNLAIRRAQACLAILNDKRATPGFSHVVGQAIARGVASPEALKALFRDEAKQIVIPFPLSPRGAAMGRDAGYYSGS